MNSSAIHEMTISSPTKDLEKIEEVTINTGRLDTDRPLVESKKRPLENIRVNRH